MSYYKMPGEFFNTNRYHEAQMEAFESRLVLGDQQVIEFGGKPFGDYHASRVLPGYDPDIKAKILQDLVASLGYNDVTMAMSLHAQDVLTAPNGRRISRRIRGDSGLRYDEEVLRLADQARDEFGLPMNKVILTALPDVLSEENQEYIGTYTERLRVEGLDVSTIGLVDGYPDFAQGKVGETLRNNEKPSETQHLIVVSPGGGSGKFCVAATDMAHAFERGGNPNFIKFETFPVFRLPNEHPLNVAFLAATADLPNELTKTLAGETNYDKDVENLQILKQLLGEHPDTDSPMKNFRHPTDMGVNVIEVGIVDEAQITVACMDEIRRRIQRYMKEAQNGDESAATIHRTQQYLANIATA